MLIIAFIYTVLNAATVWQEEGQVLTKSIRQQCMRILQTQHNTKCA